MLFSTLKIKAWLLRWIEEAWFSQTTHIQWKVLPIALEWKNIVWQSQTWTGKTLAYLIPVLNQVDTNEVRPQILILAPTRELVNQIYDDIFLITKYYRVPACALFGGVSQVNQVTQLKRNPRVIISTPWRLADLAEQWYIDYSSIKYLVIDEIDRLLDMGFMPAIKKLRWNLPSLTQSMCFSATVNDTLSKIFTHYMWKYEFLKSWTAPVVEKVNHTYLNLNTDDKYPTLRTILKSHKNQKVVIFTNTISAWDKLYENMQLEGYPAWLLNGDMKQSKRTSTTDAFVNGEISILVTTDVAARWLNLDNVALVINYDVPTEADSYIHRIGRTARAWAYGKAIMFVTNKEKKLLEKIEITHTMIIDQSEIKVVKAPAYEFESRKSKPRKNSRPKPNRTAQWEKPQWRKYWFGKNSHWKKSTKTSRSPKGK